MSFKPSSGQVLKAVSELPYVPKLLGGFTNGTVHQFVRGRTLSPTCEESTPVVPHHHLVSICLPLVCEVYTENPVPYGLIPSTSCCWMVNGQLPHSNSHLVKEVWCAALLLLVCFLILVCSFPQACLRVPSCARSLAWSRPCTPSQCLFPSTSVSHSCGASLTACWPQVGVNEPQARMN